MTDTGLLRKRVKAAIDQARRDAAERRARATEATKLYETFLTTSAVPAFRAVANVLKSEGVAFEVTTPAGGVRLVSERQRDDAIDLELDPTLDPPEPLVTVTRVRGSRSLRTERSIKGGTPLSKLTEEDVIEMLLAELRPWMT
jgi:hypothetical protein